MEEARRQSQGLPWWTWIVPLIAFHLGSEISVFFKYTQGAASFYLPTAFGIILINWWGPMRVLPALYVNAMLSNPLWDNYEWLMWPAYALPETLLVFLSWLLFSYFGKGRYWLPDLKSLLLFMILGVIIPIIPEILLLDYFFADFRDIKTASLAFALGYLGDYSAIFGLTLPVLYYATPLMARARLLQLKDVPHASFGLDKVNHLEILVVYFIMTLAAVLIDYEKFWFIYGILSIYIAIRCGFGWAVTTNFYIFLITYIIPSFLFADLRRNFGLSIDLVNIYLGTSLLYVLSAITGRMMSDVRLAEQATLLHAKALEQTNKELDRFVYSVSHDLSAPLKSILGLVNISKLDSTPIDKQVYLGQIEVSVRKLETFIGEILDYSRNKRLELELERIQLKELCSEILDNLKFMDEFAHVKVRVEVKEDAAIYNDRMRLKIILNNLITNAIKFQKQLPGHEPLIIISAYNTNESTVISIEDNGEGIRPQVLKNIFEMFYRGNDRSKGSGLGLYIAKETAERISGEITVESEYGKGSIFRLKLKSIVL